MVWCSLVRTTVHWQQVEGVQIHLDEHFQCENDEQNQQNISTEGGTVSEETIAG